MQGVNEAVSETAALEIVYKNLRMGTDGIINLLPYVKQSTLRSAMTVQLDGYEKYAALVRVMLQEEGIIPKDVVGMRLVAKMGAAWRGMMGITRTELAKALIEASNACITDMTRLLNHISVRESKGARLMREVLALEENHVEILKAYL